MRSLVYFVASTIDGFVADPGGGDPSGPDGLFVTEQDYLDHLVEEYPETLPAPARQALGVEAGNRHFDTVVMGRRTYEIGAEVGLTSPYPQLRQYVVSRTMGERPDPAVEVVGGDPVAAVQDLKQADGKDIWLCGGGKLAAALRPEIDELVVKLNPVAIGSGVPLFDGPFQPFQFRLAASHALPSGVLFLTYRRAGSSPTAPSWRSRRSSPGST
jgi:dihydrofolate reductase